MLCAILRYSILPLKLFTLFPSAYQLWAAESPEEGVCSLAMINSEFALDESSNPLKSGLLFAGHFNGQISLISGKGTLGTRGFFSRATGSFVSSAAGRHVFGRRSKTRVANPRGSLFKTWSKPETTHEKPLAPRVRKRCNTITLFKLRGRRINNLSSWRNCFCAGGAEGARKFKASPHHSPHGFAGPLPKQERREVMTSQKPNFWNCMRLVGKSW